MINNYFNNIKPYEIIGKNEDQKNIHLKLSFDVITWLVLRIIAFGIGYIAGWLAFGFTLAILAGLII